MLKIVNEVRDYLTKVAAPSTADIKNSLNSSLLVRDSDDDDDDDDGDEEGKNECNHIDMGMGNEEEESTLNANKFTKKEREEEKKKEGEGEGKDNNKIYNDDSKPKTTLKLKLELDYGNDNKNRTNNDDEKETFKEEEKESDGKFICRYTVSPEKKNYSINYDFRFNGIVNNLQKLPLSLSGCDETQGVHRDNLEYEGIVIRSDINTAGYLSSGSACIEFMKAMYDLGVQRRQSMKEYPPSTIHLSVNSTSSATNSNHEGKSLPDSPFLVLDMNPNATSCSSQIELDNTYFKCHSIIINNQIVGNINEITKKVILEDSAYFYKQKDISNALRISTALFSKRWKQQSSQKRWPYRKVQSIDRKIVDLMMSRSKYGKLPKKYSEDMRIYLRKRQNLTKRRVLMLSDVDYL